MKAFNYDTQQWETGQAAAALRIDQIYKELFILRGSTGQKYAESINRNKSELIQQLKTERDNIVKKYYADDPLFLNDIFK